MFTVINKEDILPQYPCGGRGSRVNVNIHGTNWATWKLLDDLDKHVGVPRNITGKAKCETCYKKLYSDQAETEEAWREYVSDMTEAIQKTAEIVRTKIEQVQKIAFDAADKFFSLYEVLRIDNPVDA